MKKSFAFISILAVLSALMFADVSATKNADGTVDVTFFYGNPRATEVLLAGDFTSWQDGALPMTKVENGFTITHTFKAGDEARYKFISDGNWTTDLRAPDFVDDGFGGKNSHIVIADLVGGGDDDGASRARINFVSWTMIGAQANYLTQGASDATKKGMDLDSVNVGFKSYNKFVGNFLPNSPLYIEIALAETDLEDYSGEGKIKQIYKKNVAGIETITWEDGLKGLVNGIFGNPAAYLARATDNSNSGDQGPGTNPFLGHLKFGWNTPYVNYTTGFNYAKPDVRQAITWLTVDGSWDAGYQHVGGFNVFSMGDKVVAALEEATGLRFDVGFAPNKTGDRKGTKYGYWGWAGVSNDLFSVDFQSNGMYGDDYLFYDPVEHDFIIGAKTSLELGDGKLDIAAQGLLATHQKSSADILASGASNTTDYFGYSTDVFYRSGNFGLRNIAANVQAGYKTDMFGANLEYRLRGAEASMLYVRQNHDDGVWGLSDQLGVLNSQRVAFEGWVKPLDALQIDLGVNAVLPLETLDSTQEIVQKYMDTSSNEGLQSWYLSRFGGEDIIPLFQRNGGAEFTFEPAVSYSLEDFGITVGAYADMNYQAYTYTDGLDAAVENKYSSSDSPFRVSVAGATFAMKPDSDIIKGVNVYYGLDMSNDVKMFNTLVGKVDFPMDISASLAFGLKTENKLSADTTFNKDTNNPFAFAVGVSKKFQALKKPILYAQFVYNMDPFKHFGDGQDALNLDRANVKGSHEKEGVGVIDSVDWYDGRAAMRVGIRWDI